MQHKSGPRRQKSRILRLSPWVIKWTQTQKHDGAVFWVLLSAGSTPSLASGNKRSSGLEPQETSTLHPPLPRGCHGEFGYIASVRFVRLKMGKFWVIVGRGTNLYLHEPHAPAALTPVDSPTLRPPLQGGCRREIGYNSAVSFGKHKNGHEPRTQNQK